MSRACIYLGLLIVVILGAIPKTLYAAVESDISFSLGAFTANYYDQDVSVATEQVGNPSINYAWSDFHGIQSENFSAVWTGSITVSGAAQMIDINFDVSWSNVTFSVDGVVISDWSNSSRTIEHLFSVGTHDITVEYQNNWHTTNFNVSFSDHEIYSKDAVRVEIAPLITPDTHIVYVGAYESNDLYNESKISLSQSDKPVFLFVSSYNAVNWSIDNPHDVDIKGVVYGSYGHASSVSTAEGITTIEVTPFALGYDDFTDPGADIHVMTGRLPDQTQGKYDIEDVVIELPGGGSDDVGSDSFFWGAFTATYYDQDALIATEQVKKPSINYAWSDFHGIRSEGFSAVWTGTLTVSGAAQVIDAHFDVSRSDVTFSVDGVVISDWSNSSRTIEHLFSPGTHDITVEFHNNWHTTSFNMSFSDHDIYSTADVSTEIAPLITPDTHIVYVGAYESSGLYNESKISLGQSDKSVFLFVSSYRAVNWSIDNPHNVDIRGVVYGSLAPASSVSTAEGIAIFEVNPFAYGYDEFTNPSADIHVMVGRLPDQKQGKYDIADVGVELPVTVDNDFNGDGTADILWRNVSDAQVKIAVSDSQGNQAAVIKKLSRSADWLFRSGDFNGDGRADSIWHNQIDGRVRIELSSEFDQGILLPLDSRSSAWRADTADFNGDGRDDILWRNPTSGKVQVAISASDGSVERIEKLYDKSAAWTHQLADFNGDGRNDILWRKVDSGDVKVSISDVNGNQVSIAVHYSKWSAWDASLADFNGDGRADILWRNASSGDVKIAISGSDGGQESIAKHYAKFSAWTHTLADFNGDGRSDILWRKESAGIVKVALSDGSGAQGQVETLFSKFSAWTHQIGDFNGDGRDDILWRNQSKGEVKVALSSAAGNQERVERLFDKGSVWQASLPGAETSVMPH